ncbi:ZZ-type zinc finger-containing protein 3 isoform X1 [Euwallacea similis]|uniref:ZZ-type zinc finger-containing protein 3 isoform X1 n=1 Tax=Euwallacea similis TaxID=1736056 RepID=UPI00344D5ACC
MEDLTPAFDVENDLFSFETDHLALKGNEDYCEVLKTLVILSAQREQALKDYKTVAELRSAALNDPFATLEKIQNGQDLEVPALLQLPKLPVINFKKYKVKAPERELMEIYSDVPLVEEKTEINQNPNNNRSWSPEEQKRLEELLQIYPPEPIEMRRFHKIAKALGNRTVQQVASRLQKYFLKLYKAGLPIPGRIPKSAEKYRKSAQHKHQRHNHYLWKPTTFFPGLSLPVQMEDLNNIPGPSTEASNLLPSGNNTIVVFVMYSTAEFAYSENENYLIRTDYHQAPEATAEITPELQLKLLKRVREIKGLEQADSYSPFTHEGFKCDYCEDSPIMGTRWHCTTCPDSVDFCTDCVVSQMYTETPHSLSHWLACFEGASESLLLEDTTGQEYDKQISEELKGRINNEIEELSE